MAYCDWKNTSKENFKYHNTEWGIPVHNDITQFEYLMLEVMQCGLNWNIIILKREIFRSAFDNFNYSKISKYTEKDVKRIMNIDGMIKSERKIKAVINNAKCFEKVRAEFKSFCNYIWSFSGGKIILYENHQNGKIPVCNGLSKKISKDLKKRGFKYLGPITVYSHLQACGVINDHDKSCERYKYIVQNFPTTKQKCDDEEF